VASRVECSKLGHVADSSNTLTVAVVRVLDLSFNKISVEQTKFNNSNNDFLIFLITIFIRFSIANVYALNEMEKLFNFIFIVE
jgi:hypothetical protein